jgi:hypothetical protein
MSLGGAILAAVLAASPAAAGDAACIWNRLPQANRDAYLAKAVNQSKPTDEDTKALFAGVEPKAVVTACRARATDATALKSAIMVLAGYAYREFAVRRFARERITRAQLDRGWATMDPAARQLIIDSAVEARPEPVAAVHDFVVHAGLKDARPSDPKIGQALIYYVLGAALVAGYEPKF